MGLLAALTGKQSTQTNPASNTLTIDRSRYRSVQVKAANEECCQAVQTLLGKRFLSHEVPKLPLDGCDAHSCQCTYELHDDRRADIRRASDVAYDMASQYCESDNRDSNSPGRRAKDEKYD
ncbi:MAG: hypothetical protein OER97_06670 [Gammaproteobacteria bacterium]|nr:hypothetical protein [Gammaproteobacteria bacterium]